ncbi:MAG: glycosyltransferase family 9 protein [Panacagrimonas sp.]
MTSALPPPRRILIVRISALGDLVFCTSLLQGLRRAYPNAHIAWLAQPGFAGVLEDDARLSELIRLPAQAFAFPAGWLATRRFLAGLEPFDWVIDAQGLLKTRLLARGVPATHRLGFASGEPGKFLVDRLIEKGGDIAEISSEYRFLAHALTGRDPGAPSLFPTLPPRRRVHEQMREAKLHAGFVALCPFTTRPQKHWMEEYWPDLAMRLIPKGLWPCVLFGGPADRAAAQRLMARMPAGTVDLVGKTAVPDLPAWLEQAGLVIGVDTGLTHIGVALQRPVLALFGSTCPYTRGADSPLRVMFDALPCAPCRRHPTCGGAFTCMRQLTPDRVAAAAFELLGDAPKPFD